MPSAVVLYFDAASEKAIRKIWKNLAKIGIPDEIEASGIQPHITLAVYDRLDCEPCENELEKFAARGNRLDIQAVYTGIFFHPETVLFLSISVTPQLLDFHAEIQQSLQHLAGKPWELYQPGNWVPHCTLAMNLKQKELHQALALCRKLDLPMRLHAARIGAVEFLPVGDLFQYELKKD